MYWSFSGFDDGFATCGRAMLLPVLRYVRRADAVNAVRGAVCNCVRLCGARLYGLRCATV